MSDKDRSGSYIHYIHVLIIGWGKADFDHEKGAKPPLEGAPGEGAKEPEITPSILARVIE